MSPFPFQNPSRTRSRIATRLALTSGFLAFALLGTPGAYAERLGGAYRGPSDAKAAQDDSSSTDSATSGGEDQKESGKTEGSSSSDSSGGVSGGEGGGDSGSSGGSSGGESGGSSGGESGGAVGGGSSSGGSSTASSSDTGSTGGSGPGGGGGGKLGKGGSAQQDQLVVVAWYFEHNRERFLWDAMARRSTRIRAPKYSTPAIMAVARPVDREVSSVTTEDRERIFDVLEKNTLAQEDVVRDAAVIALGKLGTPDAVRILQERLKVESKADIREDICLALGIARTPAAVDTLIDVVHNGKGRAVSFALLGLGLTRDNEKAAPAVLAWFNANQRSGRRAEDGLAAAALALGSLGYAEAEKALAGACHTKSVPDVVKVYAVHALGQIGTESARKSLEGLVEGGVEVSRAALLALGDFAEPSVAKLLAGKEGVGRADSLGAGFAAVSLGRVLSNMPELDWKKLPDEIRDLASAPAKNAVKSQYASLALTQFPGGVDRDLRAYYLTALADKKLNADTGSAVALACGLSNVGGFESTLELVMKDAGADPKLRGYAALGLGLSGDPTSTAQTLRRIYLDNDQADVRRGCLFGLGYSGDRRDVQFLLDAIVQTPQDKPFSSFTRGAAVAALGMIRDGESVQRIQGLLTNPDAYVRAYAIAALGYLADKDASPALPKLFEHANFRLEFPTLSSAMRNL